jgi:hypothetical protein
VKSQLIPCDLKQIFSPQITVLGFQGQRENLLFGSECGRSLCPSRTQ